MITQNQVDKWFDPDKLTSSNEIALRQIRGAGKQLVETLMEFLPVCDDQTIVILKVREAISTARDVLECAALHD